MSLKCRPKVMCNSLCSLVAVISETHASAVVALFSSKLCPRTNQRASSPPLEPHVQGFEYTSHLEHFFSTQHYREIWFSRKGHQFSHTMDRIQGAKPGRQDQRETVGFQANICPCPPQNMSFQRVQLLSCLEICSDHQVCESNRINPKKTVGGLTYYNMLNTFMWRVLL